MFQGCHGKELEGRPEALVVQLLQQLKPVIKMIDSTQLSLFTLSITRSTIFYLINTFQLKHNAVTLLPVLMLLHEL